MFRESRNSIFEEVFKGRSHDRMLTVALGAIILSLIAYTVSLAKKVGQHWKKKGIKHKKPILFFGNSLPVILNRKHTSEVIAELCSSYPEEPILGFYDTMKPKLIVQDPDYINKILIKDFAHFTDHGIQIAEDVSPIDSYQLPALNGNQWRAFRYKLSPLFTSKKLISMFQCIIGCGDNLIKFLENRPKTAVNLQEVLALFSMDVISSAALGIDARVLDNPDSEFRKMGKKMFQPTIISFLKFSILTTSTWLSKKLRISVNNQEVVQYFCKIIGDTLRYRKENNICRNDFIQMMVQLKDQGRIEISGSCSNYDHHKNNNANPKGTFEITDTILMSQAFTLLTAGFDLIAYTLVYALMELSNYPEIQDKALKEIQTQLKIHSKFSYEALKDMVYLENIINETLRLHPAAPTIFRVCTKDYTFPNGYTIRKGEYLTISTVAVHKNPLYHEDPLVFRPERHENPMKTMTFIPFGDGPRICIAMRFALLQLKYGLARILKEYKVTLNPTTKLPVRMEPKIFLNMPDKIMLFDLEKVTHIV